MKKIRIRNLNLYQKFSLVIILFGLIPMLVLSTIVMNWMFKEYGDSLRNNYEQAAVYVCDSVNDVMENLNEISKISYYYNDSSEGKFEFNYMSFDNVRKIVYGIGIEPEKIEETRKQNMRVFLSNVRAIDSSISGVHFIGRDLSDRDLRFHYFRTGISPVDEELFDKRTGMEDIDENSKKLILTPTHKNDYFSLQNRDVFTVGRNYFDLTGSVGNYTYVGTLLIDVEVDRLASVLDNVNLGSNDRVYICDRMDNCYYSNEPGWTGASLKEIMPSLKENKAEFVIHTDYNSYGLKVIITMEKELAFGKLRHMQVIMYLFLGVCLIALLSGSVLFSRRLTRPIRSMMDQMSQIETGNFRVELPVTSGDEIGVLSQRFNQMSRELEKYINQSYLAHMKQAEAEMTALKSQIYPHFLYNTLEIIRMTAVEKDDMVVSEMIEALSQQIRYMIGPMQDVVPLEQEVDIIRKYIYLLNCRIRGEVKLIVDLNGLKEQSVPKLILQPIVENAYVHGIKPREGNGRILIGAEHVGAFLEISVMDNGIGMTEAELEKLKELLDGDEPGIKNEYNWQSIGLKNVNDRIRYLYGEEYGIRVTSTPMVGTMVRIVMPWGEREAGHAEDDSRR